MSFMDKTKETTASDTKTTALGGQHSVTGIYGWICPVCGRGVAPGQKYCVCRPQLVPVYPSYPVYPYWWYQVTCGTASSTSDLSNSKATYTTTGISTKVGV